MTTHSSYNISKNKADDHYYQHEKTSWHGYFPEEELKSDDLGILEENYQKQTNQN